MKRERERRAFAATIHRLTDGLAVAAAPATERDIQELARIGFRSLVDLRGAGEPIIGMPPAREREIAERHGLGYRHLPISVSSLGVPTIDRARDELWAAEAPVLIHCGSGRRAWLCALIHLGCQHGWTVEQCLDLAAQHDVQLGEMPALRDFLRAYIESNSRAYLPFGASATSPVADSYQI